jgi:hypothetical protein
MDDSSRQPSTLDRRHILMAGGGSLAALAGIGTVTVTNAQEATPVAGEPVNREGYYGVTRSYVLTPDADVDELIDKVRGFVDIVSAVPGFASYTITLDREAGIWNALSVFDTAENAQRSTDAAAEYVAANELGSYFVDPVPTVVEGEVVISA